MGIKKFNSYNEKKSYKQIKESADYENDNYMFFANLQHINRMSSEIMNMDESEIDEMLTDGHDWANDHISKSMESIEHVYNFLLSSLDKKDDHIEQEQDYDEIDEIETGLDEIENEIEEMEEMEDIQERNIKSFKNF